MKQEDLDVGAVLKRIPDDGWRGCVIASRVNSSELPKCTAVAVRLRGGKQAVHLLHHIIEDLILDLNAFDVDRDWVPEGPERRKEERSMGSVSWGVRWCSKEGTWRDLVSPAKGAPLTFNSQDIAIQVVDALKKSDSEVDKAFANALIPSHGEGQGERR